MRSTSHGFLCGIPTILLIWMIMAAFGCATSDSAQVEDQPEQAEGRNADPQDEANDDSHIVDEDVLAQIPNAGEGAEQAIVRGDLRQCETNEDCAPAHCCHPTACVPITEKPACGDVLCTMDCSGPMDCGAGSCACLNNRCSVLLGGSDTQ